MKLGPIQKPRSSEGSTTGAAVVSLALAATLPALAADVAPQKIDPPLTNVPRIDVPIPNLDRTFGAPAHEVPFKFTGTFTGNLSQPAQPSVTTTQSASEAALNPASPPIGPIRSVFHWLDETIGNGFSWLSDMIGIGTFVAGAIASIVVIRSYRKNPQSLRKESMLLRVRKAPTFVHMGKDKMKDIFGDLVERLAVYSAARKATEKFPVLFVNPVRYPEVVSEFRDAIATKDLKSEIEGESGPEDLKMRDGKWHLVIVPRKSYLGSSPIVRGDFFTFTKMVAMLEEPVKIYHQLEGLDRRHLIYHLEEAALVSYLHPTILTRAIREAHVDKLAELPGDKDRVEFIKNTESRLTHNAKVLLRLLCFSTEESLEIFDAAKLDDNLDHLMDTVPFERIEEMIANRRHARTLYERTLEPLIHWVWNENNADKVWLAAKTPPGELGLFDCCTVAQM